MSSRLHDQAFKMLSHIPSVISYHRTRSFHHISQLLFCRNLDASSFSGSPDLTVPPPVVLYVQNSAESWQPTRENSRFGEGTIAHAKVHFRGGRQQSLAYVRRAHRRSQSWSRRFSHAELRTEQRLWSNQINKQVSESHPQPTKVTRTTSIMEFFFTDLFKYQIVMKPINITKCTKQVALQTRHPGMAFETKPVVARSLAIFVDKVVGWEPSQKFVESKIPSHFVVAKLTEAESGEGSYADFSRQVHVQRYRIEQGRQRANVYQQRSTSCRFLQGFQAKSLVLHWAQICAVLKLRHDCRHLRNVGRDRREDDRHLHTVRTSSLSSCGKYEEQNVEVQKRNNHDRVHR